MWPEASSVKRGVGHSGGPGHCLSRNFQGREGTSEATPGLRALTSYGPAPGMSSAEAGSGEGHLSASCQPSANTETAALAWGRGGRGARAGLRAALTLQVASAVAARVDPGRAIVADAPYHAPAAGLHHPQVAAHLPPEPGRRREAAGGAVPLPLGPRGLPDVLIHLSLASQ